MAHPRIGEITNHDFLFGQACKGIGQPDYRPPERQKRSRRSAVRDIWKMSRYFETEADPSRIQKAIAGTAEGCIRWRSVHDDTEVLPRRGQGKASGFVE